MGGNLFITFLLLLLTVSGGPNGGNGRGNDLLDMIPTASYWRVKGVTVSREQLETDAGIAKAAGGDIPTLVKNLESLRKRDDAKKQLEAIGAPALEALRAETNADDPEAAAMARDLVAGISGHGKVAEVRRLMAIRTLGERKENASLPLLKSLLDSKELFVADYAERAIAAIEGTPLKAVDHHADLAGDLDLLPASTGIVAQTTGLGMPGFNLDALVAQAYAANNPGKPAQPGVNDDTVDRLTKNLLDYAEAVGNVRADGMTVAISGDIGSGMRGGGGANEWFIVSVHGLYDRDAVADFTAKLMGSRASVARDGEMVTLAMDREGTVLFPSNKQLVFAVANPENTPPATIVGPLTQALTSGNPGTLSDNKTLAALIKSVDKTGPLWAAAIPSATMKGQPAFAFDTLTLSAKEQKDDVLLTATGRGTADAAGAKGQVTGLQDQLGNMLKDLVAGSKDIQPLADAVSSITVTVDEKGATATAKVSKDIGRSVLALMMQQMPGLILTPPRREGVQQGMPMRDLP